MAPEDDPADDVEMTKEDWDAYEDRLLREAYEEQARRTVTTEALRNGSLGKP